jgi:hypothetical protein
MLEIAGERTHSYAWIFIHVVFSLKTIRSFLKTCSNCQLSFHQMSIFWDLSVRIVPIGHALPLLDNGVFLDIEAKQTHWTVKKISMGSEHVPLRSDTTIKLIRNKKTCKIFFNSKGDSLAKNAHVFL